MIISSIGKVLISLAFVLGALAFITSIGYFLYQWSNLDIPIATSAWLSFVLWLKIEGSALAFGFIGVTLFMVGDL